MIEYYNPTVIEDAFYRNKIPRISLIGDQLKLNKYFYIETTIRISGFHMGRYKIIVEFIGQKKLEKNTLAILKKGK